MRNPSTRRATRAAAAIATVGVLPAFLVGALGPELGSELGITTSQLGVAVSAAFLAQAAVASPVGALLDRIGPRAGVRAAAVAAALIALALSAADSWPMLTVLLAAGGIANGVAQLAASTTLAHAVPASRQGAAFGIKEAAKPAATLVCGLAMPLVVALGSWRLAFAGCAVAALMMLRAAGAVPAAAPRESAARRARPSRGLVVIAVGSALGAAVATPLGAFLVQTLADAGFSSLESGALLAAGSLASIAARVTAGVHADRFAGRQLRWVAAMLCGGAAGLALLATGEPVALVAGTLVAFAGAWGWPGLLNLAVVRRHRDAAGAAAGVVLAGTALGGGLGPLAFGLGAEAWSFGVAWGAWAALAGVAALTVLAGRRELMRTDLVID